MNILTVTTLNQKLYDAYAWRFFDTYNWPFDLTVYSEDMTEIPGKNIDVRSLYDEVPDCKEFVDRNISRRPISEFGVRGNDFVKDGVRFCYKVYSYTDQLLNNYDYDGIIGIDIDSIFYNPIDVDWIKKHIHRDDSMMTYLGRKGTYSECGFLYWNMKHKDTPAYAQAMKNMYDSDKLYDLEEQHDSYVWDYVRKEFELANGTKNHNIGDDKKGHVQARSVLGSIYDHAKGPRKMEGRSPEARV